MRASLLVVATFVILLSVQAAQVEVSPLGEIDSDNSTRIIKNFIGETLAFVRQTNIENILNFAGYTME